MKIITVRTTKHIVYESDTEFRETYPDLPIRETFEELEEGDWIRSRQGFIVQCLKRTVYVDNSRGTGARKTPRLSYYFKFPRLSKSIRHNKLNDTLFYFPTSDKFESADIENYPLAHRPKVKLFIAYIQHGLDPQAAYAKAFGAYNKRKASFLLSRKDVIDAIMKNGAFMKQELEQAGFNKAEFAKEIVKIVKDNKENAVVRKWALETVNNVLNNIEPEATHTNFDAVLEASNLN